METVQVKPGECLVFSEKCIHATAPYTGTGERRMLFYTTRRPALIRASNTMRCNALPAHQMALFTSDCVPFSTCKTICGMFVAMVCCRAYNTTLSVLRGFCPPLSSSVLLSGKRGRRFSLRIR